MSDSAPHEESKLTVGGDQADIKVDDGVRIDMIERDPEQINQHLKVTFSEIFAEPHKTIFSFDGVWSLSHKLFSNTKLWCYRITTLICAVPAAVCWGIYFALLSCCTIWCCIPSWRAYSINLHFFGKIYKSCIDATLVPMIAACSMIFSNIKITLNK